MISILKFLKNTKIQIFEKIQISFSMHSSSKFIEIVHAKSPVLKTLKKEKTEIMSLVQNALKKDFSIGDYKEHLQLALKDLEWEGLELSKRQGGPATHDSVSHLYHLIYILTNPAFILF